MKKKRLLIGIISLLFILLALPIAGSKTSEAAKAKTLVVGNLQFLTGFLSGFGIQGERELQALGEIVNENGGITVDGQKYNIEIATEDCRSSMDGAAAATRKLTFDKKVKFAIGSGAIFATASSPIFNENKVVFVNTTDTLQPGEMSADTPYTFLGIASPLGYNYGVLEGIKEVWPTARNIVYVCPDDGATSVHILPLCKQRAESLGFTVAVDPVLFPNEMIDFSPIGAQLNAIEDADVFIFATGPPPAAGGIIKTLRSLGNTTPFVVASIMDCNDLKTIAGKEAGTLMSLGFTPGDPNTTAIINEISDRVAAEYGPGPVYLYWANCLYVLLDAIEKAQSLDPDVVKAKWESMDTIDTLFGEGKMGGLVSYGVRHAVGHPLPVQTLIDGEVKANKWIFVDIP